MKPIYQGQRMQENQTSSKHNHSTSQETTVALKPYQKPAFFKIDDNLSEVEGGACNVSESGNGLLS